jgi:archaellum component FlaG (FlaF/FlaG flagellin family)
MADGGSSTIIMLVTALLISSAASAVLVQEWSSTSRAIQTQQKGLQLSEEIGIDFAGDPMMVSLNIVPNPTPNQIIFYIQNTGVHVMDETTLAVLVEGVNLNSASISTSYVPVISANWAPNVLLQVTLADASLNGFAGNTEVSIYASARSVSVAGITMSTSLNEEVRLSE